MTAAAPARPRQFTHLPKALHHPERDPSYLTEGREVARTARLMGRTLMPWQARAVEVATEYRLDPWGQRVYHYKRVIVTVPRQSGKTTVCGPVMLHRCLRIPRASVWYTAQTGKDARKRMSEYIDLISGPTSPARALVKPIRAAGGSGIVIPGNGSQMLHFAPTKSALHGETPHLGMLDEFWKLDQETGTALVGAINPAQITLGNRAQVWWVSTMGTLDSTFMNDLLADAEQDPNTCLIRYSCPPDMDPMDPASWWAFHPALGNTIQEEDIAAELSALPKSEFLRAYANQLTATDHAVIDLDAWDALAAGDSPPPDGPPTLAVEVAPENAAAAVVAAWRGPDDRPMVRVVHRAEGTAWLVPYVAELAQQLGITEVAADGAGPIGRHAAALEDEGLTVRRLTMAEFGQACEALLASAHEGTLGHLPLVDPRTGDPLDPMRDEVAALELRTTNGVRRFSRDHSPRPIPALVAAAVALHVHDHPPVDHGPQLFV